MWCRAVAECGTMREKNNARSDRCATAALPVHVTLVPYTDTRMTLCTHVCPGLSLVARRRRPSFSRSLQVMQTVRCIHVARTDDDDAIGFFPRGRASCPTFTGALYALSRYYDALDRHRRRHRCRRRHETDRVNGRRRCN